MNKNVIIRSGLLVLAAVFLTILFALPALAQGTPTASTKGRTALTRDIYLKGRIAIGGVKQVFSVMPGNDITLHTGDGTYIPTTGKYAFDISYTMVNGGTGATSPFNNRIVDNGAGISGVQGQTLNAGEVKVVKHAKVMLVAGDNEVTILLDDANVVSETDENNNKATVKIHIL